MVGTILLTKDNHYARVDGSLPTRPKFDKALLTAMCATNSVSFEGYQLLPSSIQEKVSISFKPKVPITIKELAKANILIVVRSTELLGAEAKEFRLDKFEQIVKQRDIEIWSRKDEFR